MAVRGPAPEAAVEAILAELTQAPGTWAPVFAREVDSADERGVALLCCDAELTVMHVDLEPGFSSRVHDHGLWAVIGVYEGQEDNTFYAVDGRRVTATGEASAVAPGTLRMGARAVHHIDNPLSVRLRAVHVYGGDMRTVHRSSWNVATGERTPEGGAASSRGQ